MRAWNRDGNRWQIELTNCALNQSKPFDEETKIQSKTEIAKLNENLHVPEILHFIKCIAKTYKLVVLMRPACSWT